MEAFESIGNAFSAWLNRVAEAIVAAAIRFKSIPTIALIEGEGGRFSVRTDGKVAATGGADGWLQLSDLRAGGPSPSQFEVAVKGSRVELTLRPERFIFKTMELPSRAAEFLNGVVRSQIDRLTPWSADHAAFGVQCAGRGRCRTHCRDGRGDRQGDARSILADVYRARRLRGEDFNAADRGRT